LGGLKSVLTNYVYKELNISHIFTMAKEIKAEIFDDMENTIFSFG
jgi:hypothetical protein